MDAGQCGVSEGGRVLEWVPPAGECEAAKAVATVDSDVLDISAGYLSRLKSILGIFSQPLSWMGSTKGPDLCVQPHPRPDIPLSRPVLMPPFSSYCSQDNPYNL